MVDLKKVYQAVTEEDAFEHLAQFEGDLGQTVSFLRKKLGGQLGYPLHFLRISRRDMVSNYLHILFEEGVAG